MSEATPPPAPSGELVIRTIAMPANTNSNGDIFGGWLVSQMDLGGAIYARNVARSRITTAAIDGMSFLNPVYVGDIDSCHATLLKVGPPPPPAERVPYDTRLDATQTAKRLDVELPDVSRLLEGLAWAST